MRAEQMGWVMNEVNELVLDIPLASSATDWGSESEAILSKQVEDPARFMGTRNSQRSPLMTRNPGGKDALDLWRGWHQMEVVCLWLWTKAQSTIVTSKAEVK